MAKPLRPFEVAPNECIWHDDNGKPWLVKATFARVGERMEVVGMEVRSVQLPKERHLLKTRLPKAASGKGIAINSKVWRTAGTLIADMRRHYFEALEESGLIRLPGNEKAAVAWRAPKDRVEASLPDVAAIYNAAVIAGQSTTSAVGEHFGLSPSAAAKRIQRAREARLLPPARRGRRPHVQP